MPTPQTTQATVQIYSSSPTPTPQVADPASQSPMLAQSQLGGGWNDGYNQGPFLSALPRTFDQRFHKRGSSGSSVASAGPPSPLNPNVIYPHIVATSDSNFPTSFDFDYTQTPHTAKSESTIMYPTHTGYGAIDMRRIQSTGGDERSSYNLSAPQSVSTMSHNSPSTPHTTYESQDYDMKDQNIYGYPSGTTAAYQQALHDVFPTEFSQQQLAYNQAQQNMQRLNMAAAPHRQTMMAERLQAAQQDHLRTSSPTSNPREKSPFRHNSPYMAAPQQRQAPPTLQKQRTSVSPKELMLDEHDIDDNATPLFSQDHAQSMFGNRRTASSLSQFYTPDSSMQVPQQYPFMSQNRSPLNSGLPDMNPEFPAHMISMESTADEGSVPSSQQSVQSRAQPQVTPRQHQTTIERSKDTSSDSGTYSCTYHGCHQRFESPAKLQKHKREGHRQTSPTSSQSPNLALRNSQAGPHRCDRINPSTGKPCASVFSRPYDLTRHEDTIHNGRKQKVRCHLCTEEKTFSRNDALTRHMRVVHPDVDWVGKPKRKSPK
ncbi:hypothetical protein, variant [Exophiala mesophila]|uniref:C2H2-type domain-containing protein n=1 Tax=Exophiala mesophila TaxID=212818 RepID=A0A0D1ZLU5_EXOME|nr:hypothetical protein, variant [Exophiala mesophila]KIV94909.1 hypothetical protein, variant [Exophiala mesophila]